MTVVGVKFLHIRNHQVRFMMNGAFDNGFNLPFTCEEEIQLPFSDRKGVQLSTMISCVAKVTHHKVLVLVTFAHWTVLMRSSKIYTITLRVQ